MSKFKVHLKLQGFELAIEGAREDIPAIGQSIGNQIANMIEPISEIAGGETDGRKPPAQGASPTLDITPRKKSKRRTKQAPSDTAGSEASSLTWQHDPAKYGTPLQSWNTATKSIWLLYVIKEELQITQLSAKQIKETFNTNFKQAGAITLSNTSRDLGKAKAKGKTSPVAEDNSKSPSEWYLTDAGIAQAQGLIAGTES